MFLDQGDRDRRVIGNVAMTAAISVEARHLRRAPAPFAGNDLVALRLARLRAPSGRTTMAAPRPAP